MEKYFKQALSLVKAQARVRVMQEEEMLNMLQKLTLGISKLCEGENALANLENSDQDSASFLKNAIKERSILCLECGKSFRVITKKHLQKHNITAEEYREKYGYKKNTPLVCKSLQRDRRKKMREMKLWERRTSDSENID